MLTLSETVYALIFSFALIATGYQFYFLPQRMPIKRAAIGSESYFDKKVTFQPWWVWLYSGLYYPYILFTILTLTNLNEYYSTCISYVTLLLAHVFISYLYPVRTPRSWRRYKPSFASERFLKFIQRIDRGGNCLPSMHVAVATLTAIHITANGYCNSSISLLILWVFPVLISASALFTKQHYFIDIILGAAFAVFVYYIWRHALPMVVSEDPRSLLLFFALVGAWLFILTGSRAQRRKTKNAIKKLRARFFSIQKLRRRNAYSISNDIGVTAGQIVTVSKPTYMVLVKCPTSSETRPNISCSPVFNIEGYAFNYPPSPHAQRPRRP